MPKQPYRLGIAGLGTVGSGVIKLIQSHADLLAQRAGRRIEIIHVNARDRHKDRGVDVSAYHWADNPQGVMESVDCVLEMIGGEEGAAKLLVETALQKGISVVTANKALVAHHGAELAQIAADNKASLAYEAAVAGGIPIIKALREGFAGNEIKAVYGILNGTCNYILSAMRETGRDFAAVLKEAQEKGYAEADPAFDVDGIDAGCKLCLLIALAFGTRPDFKSLPITGISHITSTDIHFAGELGYRIKLLGLARRASNGDIAQRVEPCMVPVRSTLGAVEGVYNAVLVEGDFVGESLLVGRGAGAGPTASAVLSDVVDLAKGRVSETFGIPVGALKAPRWQDSSKAQSPFYLRLSLLDKPGAIADVSAILRDHEISIEKMIQHGRDPQNHVPVVITTHAAAQADMKKACALIAALPAVEEKPCLIPILEL